MEVVLKESASERSLIYMTLQFTLHLQLLFLLKRKHLQHCRRGRHSVVHTGVFSCCLQGKWLMNSKPVFYILKILSKTFSNTFPEVICDPECFCPLAYTVITLAAPTGFKGKLGSRYSESQEQRISTAAAKGTQAAKIRDHMKEMV